MLPADSATERVVPGARAARRSGARRRRPRPRASSYEVSLKFLRGKLAALFALVDREVALAAVAASESVVRVAGTSAPARGLRRLALDAERACQALILLRHPASDLRFLTTALKIIPDLQRMGEVARRIRGRILAWERLHAGWPANVSRLASMCHSQVRLAIGAFAAADVARAQEAIARREMVAALHHVVVSDLLALMMEDSGKRGTGRGLLFIAKQLDGLSDQAANSAQLVLSMVRGSRGEGVELL